MKNIIKSYFGNKRGMTLVEVLTAMAILSLLIFCFTPLFLTYFESIRIAGDELKDVQLQSGVLQTVIGNYNVGKGGQYSANVTEIALELSTPSQNVVLSRTNTNGTTVSTNLNSPVTIALGTDLDNVKGDFLVSDPSNLAAGYTTISAQGTSSGLVCYPKTLTDDFIEAKIIVYGSGGIVFDEGTFASDFKLSCGYQGNISLTNGVDYTMKRLAPSMVEITIYGGGKISFETSPLEIKYKGGQHILNVEVDAPSMIMVGEQSDDGKYYYYVSRGEIIDGSDGDTAKNELAIIRREMKTTSDQYDPSVSAQNPTTLTSAMNDVEWVPAESGDGYNTMNGQKYGYYVMCGDNGQVRRFWRNNTTGNYYWGGDYTYYTDYNLNRFSNGTYINTTDKSGNASSNRVYSTDTSFKYIAMRPMYWSEGSTPDGNEANSQDRKYRTGFNMSSKRYKVAGVATTGIAHLRNLCTVSATYSDDVQFYATDGLAYTYVPKKSSDEGNSPNYNTVITFQNSSGSYNGHNVEATSGEGLSIYSNQAWGWMDPSVKSSNGGMSSYYKVYGLTDGSGNITVDTNSYPITLTSVDAIRITGNGVYEDNVTDTGKSHYFTSGVIKDADTSGDSTVGANASNARTTTTNLTYPMSNYNLYCGYIPAYMDAWGGVTGNATYPYKTTFGGSGAQYAKEWKSDAVRNIGSYSNVGRASNRQSLADNSEYNTIWRLTMGIAPIYNGSSLEWNKTSQGIIAYQYKTGTIFGYWYPQVLYYPYTNLEYAITGKYYDVNTYNNNRSEINALFPGVSSNLTIGSPTLITSPANDRLNHTTNGKIIDVTISYLSHPLAISIAANPTDDVVFDYSNNKDGGQVFYWHNRRESITFLDSASTVIPNGENDIPVSLMVGYVLGGTVMYGKNGDNASIDITSVMNNGIVFIRAGNADISMQGTKSESILESISEDAANSKTSEYMATDKDGYKLAQETNVFHQFYYLNSRTTDSVNPSKGNHIGHLKGAEYWENNRHILQRSITGPAPSTGNDGNYEYLRAHPLTDTKVTCVAWGVTWSGHPEAMWGTENGTVLSWWVDLQKVGSEDASKWNDRSVDAEFQSYKWVDTVNGKTYAHQSDGNYIDSIGSAVWASKSNAAQTFSPGSENFKYFYDKTSQATNLVSTIGFISTLETINDIAYDNDYWVAVGDQSDKDPADYCATGAWSGGGEVAKAFTENGRGGSWVNVRYWVDTNGSGKHSDDNAYYHWRAVKISTKENYNIVQINNLNGIWIATGYEDANNNDEYDNGERTVVCWARNPLHSVNQIDGWSEKVQFFANNGTSMTALDQDKVGGINSCATRTE